MNRKLFTNSLSLLTIAGVAMLGHTAQAVSTTFAAGKVLNSITGNYRAIREVIHVTLTSSDSQWTRTRWHADATSDSLYAESLYPYGEYLGTNNGNPWSDLYEWDTDSQGNPGVKPGTYTCWAVAHGLSNAGPWDAGVTQVIIVIS